MPESIAPRLAVLKALGDNTRYAIYLELARSPRPLATAEIAETLDLHPNTVRPHLERMREVGLLAVETDARGAVGRPQHRYSVAPDAPSLGLEPATYPLLAGMLLQIAGSAGLGSEEAAEAGRDQGAADAVQALEANPQPTCVAALVARLDALGFDPAVAMGDGDDEGEGDGDTGTAGMSSASAAATSNGGGSAAGTGNGGGGSAADRPGGEGGSADGEHEEHADAATVGFTHCPFRALAEANPDVVCGLHRGLVEGFVATYGGAEVEAFHTLLDRTPCQVDLVVSP